LEVRGCVKIREAVSKPPLFPPLHILSIFEQNA
jgi:hypothetical protein